jgi:hypothetical protein
MCAKKMQSHRSGEFLFRRCLAHGLSGWLTRGNSANTTMQVLNGWVSEEEKRMFSMWPAASQGLIYLSNIITSRSAYSTVANGDSLTSFYSKEKPIMCSVYKVNQALMLGRLDIYQRLLL